MMSDEVFLWWSGLCAVAAANICAWAMSAAILRRRRAQLPDGLYDSRRIQLFLSAGYVFGCAYRSILPVFDVPRICLLDTWFCSVIIGRSVATVAELCFAAQWALMLREVAAVAGSNLGRISSRVIVPSIVLAEACSWYSVLTTSNIGHVIEESIWGWAALMLVASLATVWPLCSKHRRHWLALWCAAGVIYVAFMFMVDVPMYWSRWLADEANGRVYLTLAQGVIDASSRWVVSSRWEVWKTEVVWMSLYFSVAVWLSIALIHVPGLVPARARR